MKRLSGYGLETGTVARLALTITLTLTDTGFAVLTLLLIYTRRYQQDAANVGPGF